MIRKNVFVPLTTGAFNDFSKGKAFEIRKAERGWNSKNLYSGRDVTLSHGYSGKRIYGTIGRVIFGTLEDIFEQVPFRQIEPSSINQTEAIKENLDLLGQSERYVAFEIILNES